MTEPQSRLGAQRRVDDIEAFQRERETLSREGMIDLPASQREAVSAHHAGLLARLSSGFDIDAGVRAKQLSRAVRVISIVGALATSVCLLYRQNWGLIPTAG